MSGVGTELIFRASARFRQRRMGVRYSFGSAATLERRRWSVQPTEAQIRRLARVCRERLGNPRLLQPTEGYPDSLALCTIDAIQSTGANHASVKKIVARYRAFRESQGGNPETDGVVALLGTFHDLGSADAWARSIGDSGRMSGEPDAPLKATMIEAAATALSDIEIYSAADLREVDQYLDLRIVVRSAWIDVLGQQAATTWRYLLMLAGVPGVKADRMTVRFVASALRLDPVSIQPEFAAAAIERAAADLTVSPTTLDHVVWRWQRAH